MDLIGSVLGLVGLGGGGGSGGGMNFSNTETTSSGGTNTIYDSSTRGLSWTVVAIVGGVLLAAGVVTFLIWKKGSK